MGAVGQSFRAPERKGAIAQQSEACVEERARTGRPARSDRIDVTDLLRDVRSSRERRW